MNAQFLVAAGSNGICQVYELKNTETEDIQPLAKLEAHNDYILKCIISPDVKYNIRELFKFLYFRYH